MSNGRYFKSYQRDHCNETVAGRCAAVRLINAIPHALGSGGA